MGGSIPMTREAYQRKRDEVEHMEKVQMPEIAEKIATAREEGDLKENAEYHAQREAQGMLQAKINQIKGDLSRAQIIDMSNVPKDEVAFGATVKVLDLDFDDEEEMTANNNASKIYWSVTCTKPTRLEVSTYYLNECKDKVKLHSIY